MLEAGRHTIDLATKPLRLLAFNETGQHFRVSPSNVPVMLRNLGWRTGNLVRSFFRTNWRRDLKDFRGWCRQYDRRTRSGAKRERRNRIRKRRKRQASQVAPRRNDLEENRGDDWRNVSATRRTRRRPDEHL